MCAKLNKEQMESLRYREDRLEQLQQRLERFISGSEASLLPLVRTKNGAHSEAGTWRLIDALTDALTRCEKCTPSKAETEFLRAFLYCAIRVSADCAVWQGTRGCFSDILRLSENIWPRSALELHHLELDNPYFGTDWFCIGRGFFGSMSGLYRLFSGQSVTQTLTDEEIAAVRELWPDPADEWDDVALEDMQPDDLEDVPEDPFVDGGNDNDDFIERELEAFEKMAAAFAKKEEFCRQFLIVRRLYFPVTEAAETPLPVWLRRMLDLYLAEHGYSSYLDDDRFFGVYAELKKTLSRLQSARRTED